MDHPVWIDAWIEAWKQGKNKQDRSKIAWEAYNKYLKQFKLTK